MIELNLIDLVQEVLHILLDQGAAKVLEVRFLGLKKLACMYQKYKQLLKKTLNSGSIAAP